TFSGYATAVEPRGRLERPRVRAAVEHEVLPGDVAGLGAANEGADLAELLRRAEASGRVLGPALAGDLLERLAARLGLRLDIGAEPIGVERAGEDVVDRHVVGDRLAAETGDEAGEPGASAVGQTQALDRRLHRDRRDVDDPAELPGDHPVDGGLDQEDRGQHI